MAKRPTSQPSHAKAQRRQEKAVLRALEFLREPCLLVGVSGGPDSVALLDALVRLGHRPHVCHLNHQLRGAASDGDAEFVRELAGKYGLPATIEARQVAGDENACRQARLSFFESVAATTGIPKIALAHTADDQVETFLMRLLRGAGPDGLGGMWPERQLGKLHVIRPLLSVSREEVLKYLSVHGLKYREDASNADMKFLRNRIRHELLPLLERDYNPGSRDVLLRTVEIVRAEREGDPVAAERRAIRQLSFEQVEVLRQLAKKEAVPVAVAGHWRLTVPGETVVGELGVRFIVGATFLSRPTSSNRDKNVAPTEEEMFDVDALGDSLFVRTWQEGDRFQPLGMKGEKKLQDFFVDEKVLRRQRGRVPLVCAADGRIAWVVGYRMAEPFKVSSQTKRVLRIRFQGC